MMRWYDASIAAAKTDMFNITYRVSITPLCTKILAHHLMLTTRSIKLNKNHNQTNTPCRPTCIHADLLSRGETVGENAAEVIITRNVCM